MHCKNVKYFTPFHLDEMRKLFHHNMVRKTPVKYFTGFQKKIPGRCACETT